MIPMLVPWNPLEASSFSATRTILSRARAPFGVWL